MPVRHNRRGFCTEIKVRYVPPTMCRLTIEGFNRQLRKVTKSKTVFPSDDSLLKMLYQATMDITKKWTGRRRDWAQIRAQLEIYFEERLEKLES